MIQIKNKVDCCGCTACANICPKQAITMKPDPEGFLYPVVNEENCINCGVCDATCPIHNKIDRTKEKTKGFILRVTSLYVFPNRDCTNFEPLISFNSSFDVAFLQMTLIESS